MEHLTFTLCGRRCQRHYQPHGTRMTDADCYRCWTILASRNDKAQHRAWLQPTT